MPHYFKIKKKDYFALFIQIKNTKTVFNLSVQHLFIKFHDESVSVM